MRPLFKGTMLKDEENDIVWQRGGNGDAWPTSMVAEFNASCITSGAGWHYGWTSSRYKATAKHSFRSYVFVPVGSAADGGPTNSSKQRASQQTVAAAAKKKKKEGAGARAGAGGRAKSKAGWTMLRCVGRLDSPSFEIFSQRHAVDRGLGVAMGACARGVGDRVGDRLTGLKTKAETADLHTQPKAKKTKAVATVTMGHCGNGGGGGSGGKGVSADSGGAPVRKKRQQSKCLTCAGRGKKACQCYRGKKKEKKEMKGGVVGMTAGLQDSADLSTQPKSQKIKAGATPRAPQGSSDVAAAAGSLVQLLSLLSSAAATVASPVITPTSSSASSSGSGEEDSKLLQVRGGGIEEKGGRGREGGAC